MTFEVYDKICFCPFCGKRQEKATSAQEGRPPRNDDPSICITCGEWSMFDDRTDGGLRKPTDQEYEQLVADKNAIAARSIWLKIDEERRQKKQPPPKPKFDLSFDQDFDKLFDSLFPHNIHLDPKVQISLKRVFMAGVLTCFERVSRIGELKDDKEIERRWRALKGEMIDFSLKTLSALAPRKE